MKTSLLPRLRCPHGCDNLLALSADREEHGEVWSGSLECGGCGTAYPIQEGIPRLLPRVLLGDSGIPDDPTARKLSEMKARDEQVGDYDRMWHLNLFGLVEVPATLLHLDLGSDHFLLEAGCGTGRMTPQFAARCREQVAVDFSWESLRVCAAKLRRAGVTNVHLAQADLCHLPFRTEQFDRIVSCQVLEHIPSAGAREAAVSELARALKRGGNLAISAYQYSLLMRLFGEKEGEHAGGIYFYRFTRDELRALLSRHLRVESMTGALVYHFLARCAKK
jgi:ubiquinone/menaquinone biosynthesis C-methylase UbiE/uncharacterized protein YbaR (Trm112 family)